MTDVNLMDSRGTLSLLWRTRRNVSLFSYDWRGSIGLKLVGIEEEDEGPDDKIRFLYGKRSRPNFLEGIVAREATVFNVGKTLTFIAAMHYGRNKQTKKYFIL